MMMELCCQHRRMLLSSPSGSGGVRVRAPPKKRAKMELELEKLIERLAVAEKMLEDQGLEEEYERQVLSLPVAEPAEIDNRKNSLYIETVGNIVTQCE